MFKIAIRFCSFIAFGYIALAVLTGGYFGRILFPVIVLGLVIFIIAQIRRRANRINQQKKEEPKPKAESKIETKNVVDGVWREVREKAPAPAKEASPKEMAAKEMAAAKASPAAELDPLQADIREISEAADRIRNNQIRGYVYHLEILAKDIIREHAQENVHRTSYHQFESYYIPTLKSVVNNYSRMEARGMATAKMQKDMLDYLESCDTAFSKLYNSMFEDDVFDMEVKMEAMNIILKRDGLL